MRKMTVLIAALAVIGIGSVPVRTLPPLIRLHVLAESDSAQDQALKLEVRDAVLCTAQAMLAECSDFSQAYAVLDERLDEIELAAQSAAGSENVRVQIVAEDYPVRDYGDITLPEGKYHSLKVEIGAAEGRNWWCVVYPSLCMPGAADQSELLTLTEPQPLRSLVWDWLRLQWQAFTAEQEVV